MKQLLSGIAVVLTAVVVAQSSAAVTVYFDPTVGAAFQEAQESAFLAATPPLTKIDFDDQVGGAQLTGNEYAGQGITFSQPGGYGLEALADGPNFVPRSLEIALFPYEGLEIDERLQADLTTPQQAVGMWIIDNELVPPTGGEDIRFYDSSDNLIYSTTLPSVGAVSTDENGNFFIGVVSDDPIAKIVMNEGIGEQYPENVGWDDVYFGVPEPSALLLLGLGAVLLRRR